MSVHSNGRRRPGPRAAFYDLDGTLTGLNLVQVTLFMLGNVGEWSGRLTRLAGFLARAPILLMAERRDRQLLNETLFQSFKGLSRDRLEMLGEEFCEQFLLPRLYPQALRLLEANHAAGIEPVLVTGSPDFVVAPLARKLGVKDFAANRLIYSRGVATGRLTRPVIAGSEKASWCARYAASRRLGLENCWGYADSYYDLAFLAALGHPVAVNPDSRLRAVALSRHWPIVEFADARTKAGSGPATREEHDLDRGKSDGPSAPKG